MLFLNIVTEFVNAFLNVFLAYWLFESFWQRKYQKRIILLLIPLISALYTLPLLFCKGSLLHYLSIFALTLVLSCLYQEKFLNRLFATALFFVITAAVEMIVAFLMSWMFRTSLSAIKDGVLFITGMLSSKFLSFVLIVLLRIKRRSPLFQIIKANSFSIFIFPLATFAIILLQHGIFIYHPAQPPAVSVIVLICYSLLIVANVLVFEFIDSLYKNTLYESKIRAADDIISKQIKQYETVLEHHSEVVQIRHDQKNFFIGILAELKAGNIDPAINKIEAKYALLSNTPEQAGSIIHTLVAIKNETAAKNNVFIDFEHRSLEQLVISAIDLAVILGNALDNAIEAAANVSDCTKRTINLLVAIKNKSVVIKIKNPVDREIDVNNLRTTKENPSMHGFGIISMKQLAEKYDGDVTFHCSNMEFTTSIILSNLGSKFDE